MVTAAANFMSTVAAGCTAVQALMGAAPLVAPAARRVSIWLAHVPDRADFILSNHFFCVSTSVACSKWLVAVVNCQLQIERLTAVQWAT